jgi:hypothetical protein
MLQLIQGVVDLVGRGLRGCVERAAPPDGESTSRLRMGDRVRLAAGRREVERMGVHEDKALVRRVL